MKTLSTTLLALAGALTAHTCGAATTAADCEAAVAQVRAMETQWLDAYRNIDVAAMRSILADDFMITYTDGDTEKKGHVVGALEKRRPPGADYRTRETTARCYGDTVILTGWVVNSNDKQMRYTDTYVRQANGWQVVASHLSGRD